MNEIDVSQYIIGTPTLPVPKVERRVRSNRLKDEFIPAIPLWWAIAAGKAGTRRRITGTSLVGQMLWQQQIMRKSPLVRVSSVVWRKIGLERRLVNRALAALEDAGLIIVERFKHRSPAVTIVTNKSYCVTRSLLPETSPM